MTVSPVDAQELTAVCIQCDPVFWFYILCAAIFFLAGYLLWEHPPQ